MAERSLINIMTVIILLMCCVITKSKTNTDGYNIWLRLCTYLRKIKAVDNSVGYHNTSTDEYENMGVCDRKHTIICILHNMINIVKVCMCAFLFRLFEDVINLIESVYNLKKIADPIAYNK